MVSYSWDVIFGDYLDPIGCFEYVYTVIAYDYLSGGVVKQFSQECLYSNLRHIVHICFENEYCL